MIEAGKEIGSVFAEPIKKSISSLFNDINTRTEALDLLNKYKNAYFSKLIGMSENIKILGMNHPIKLLDVYVPTKISTTIHRRLFEQDWHNLNDKILINEKLQGYGKISADKYIDKNSKVVILAPPGSGKTTFLRYLTLCYTDKDIFARSNLTKSKFPFFISLPVFAESKLSIKQYLIEELRSVTDDYAEFFVDRKLRKNRSIILMDSLDEVPCAQKKDVINKINSFCNDFQEINILISCRVADYEETIDHCHEVEITKLTDSAVEKIIKAWFCDDINKANTLIRHLKNDKDVSCLTETPLLLSLLCIQYRHDLNIPSRKAELYRRCIDALLRAWDATRNFKRDTAFSSLTDDKKEKLFECIAHHFSGNGVNYIFHEKELADVVESYIVNFGIPPNESKSVINELEKLHGIVERYSAEAYLFSHPSFQEYFTARALVAKREEISFLKLNYDNIRVNTIITFLAAIMDDPEKLLRFLIEKSEMKGLKNYPSMAKRTIILHLLYKCLNAGVTITPAFRDEIHSHIYNSQIEIAKIYVAGGVYPLAVLEPDGIRHCYYYNHKRQSLYQALQPLRMLANEILLTPSKQYASFCLGLANSIDVKKDTLITGGQVMCLLIPLTSSFPDEVKNGIRKILPHLNKNQSYFADLINKSIKVIDTHYLQL